MKYKHFFIVRLIHVLIFTVSLNPRERCVLVVCVLRDSPATGVTWEAMRRQPEKLGNHSLPALQYGKSLTFLHLL